MFNLKNVTVRYGSSVILDDLTAQLGPESVAVMGPSGSGKSTLLRALCGLQPTEGRIYLNNDQIARSTWAGAFDQRVGFVHQDYKLVEFMSILENILLSAECRGWKMEAAEGMAALKSVGLDHLQPDRMPTTLSGGEQQRLSIARALAGRCKALIADEPTGALDAQTTRRVVDLLAEVTANAGAQLIVATHDASVAACVDRVFRLENGKLFSI